MYDEQTISRKSDVCACLDAGGEGMTSLKGVLKRQNPKLQYEIIWPRIGLAVSYISLKETDGRELPD